MRTLLTNKEFLEVRTKHLQESGFVACGDDYLAHERTFMAGAYAVMEFIKSFADKTLKKEERPENYTELLEGMLSLIRQDEGLPNRLLELFEQRRESDLDAERFRKLALTLAVDRFNILYKKVGPKSSQEEIMEASQECTDILDLLEEEGLLDSPDLRGEPPEHWEKLKALYREERKEELAEDLKKSATKE